MPPFWSDMRAALVEDGSSLLRCLTLRALRALPDTTWVTIMGRT